MSLKTMAAKGVLVELGNSAKKLPSLVSGKKALIVTDGGIRKLGLIDSTLRELKSAGIGVEVYDSVIEDPSVRCVREATQLAKDMNASSVIGFGGGSSMDVAKISAVLAKSSQPIDTMYGIDQIEKTDRLQLIQIPTTAGTGSEVTPITILTTDSEEKKGIVDQQLTPDFAILDGELTLSLPKHVTSATGVDAMVHAIEAFTGKLKKNDFADALAIDALKLLGSNIHEVCDNPNNAEARSQMLLGACFAGMAFASSPVAAVHALAYPIGAKFHVPHGLSNALMLPHVMRVNSQVETCAEQYLQLAPYMLPGQSFNTALEVADAIADLSKSLNMKIRLTEVGITQSDIKMLASESMNQQRLLVNNPYEVTLEVAEQLYTAAL